MDEKVLVLAKALAVAAGLVRTPEELDGLQAAHGFTDVMGKHVATFEAFLHANGYQISKIA